MKSAITKTARSGPAMRLWLSRVLLLAAAVAVAGLLGLDTVLAKAVPRSDVLDPFVDLLEVITFKKISEFILPGILLVCGGACWASDRPRWARLLFYMGAVPLMAYIVSDLAKPQFGRLRPFEVEQPSAADTWFASGNSFPSGHVAFFIGLVLPIVVLYPRTWALLCMPLLVAAQRVLAGDHYLSDVAISFALSVAVTLLILRTVPKAVAEPRDTSAGGVKRVDALASVVKVQAAPPPYGNCSLTLESEPLRLRISGYSGGN